MGAYGAALYAKSLNLEASSTITQLELASFKHEVKTLIVKYAIIIVYYL